MDYGNKDNIVNNKVSGIGYAQINAPTAGSIYAMFDLLGSTKPHFNNNG